MSAPPQSLHSLFGGIPFLDTEFRPETLLAAVAVVRRDRVGNDTLSLISMLTPDSGIAAGGGRRAEEFELNARPLKASQQEAVAEAIKGLTEVVPHWGPLAALPVRFQLMRRDGAISASVDSLPQHVFLSTEAFSSKTQLREQVLHELSHNWLYLIAEIWRLHDRQFTVVSTLPSGTPDRSPAEVIGAAHVVTNILTLQASSPYLTPDRERQLSEYLDGCIRLIEGFRNTLTPVGREIAERIRDN
jgi:hypothetical protein